MLQAKKYIDNIQDHIQAKLEENQLSVKELERKAGLKASSVQNILSGRSSNPGIEAIISISNALDCSIDELIGKESKTQESNLLKTEEYNREAKVAWNYSLYQECTMAVENYMQSKNLKPNTIPNSEVILFFVKEAYMYSIEGNSSKADLRFIKWMIDNYFR